MFVKPKDRLNALTPGVSERNMGYNGKSSFSAWNLPHPSWIRLTNLVPDPSVHGKFVEIQETFAHADLGRLLLRSSPLRLLGSEG